jgi:two-component system, NarL family, nitrate/nitrite response regulator NarL
MKTQSAELIRIVIIDSHTLVRTGLRLILENQPGFKVVGEASKASEALEDVAAQKPDIVLLILDPLSSIGVEIIRTLSKVSSSSRVILLARPDEAQVLINAVHEGVMGIVLKTQPSEVLIKAIQKVHAGEVWIERSMIANLLSGLRNAQQLITQDPQTESIGHLSMRERQVIQQIGQGLKNNQIAKQLSLSETTVRHHLTSIYEKLGVSDRLELLVFAHRNGLD